MGDQTRLGVLQKLAGGPLPVQRLAEGSQMALTSFMQHLKVLESAQLIQTRKDGRTRICQLEPATLEGASNWIELQRATWNVRLDNLQEFLAGKNNQ